MIALIEMDFNQTNSKMFNLIEKDEQRKTNEKSNDSYQML